MDSETRSKLKQFKTDRSPDSSDFESQMELFTDWVYDQAYRKGWFHGYWLQDADYAYQRAGLRRKK